MALSRRKFVFAAGASLVAPLAHPQGGRRRLSWFGAGKTGASATYLEALLVGLRERDALRLNVNLDTVGGDTHLTALTSEFVGLERFVRDTSTSCGIPVGVYRPMMANSDHYNFACHGIPALRLVAGFDRPECTVRYILTRGDTRDKVERSDLAVAARAAAALVWQGLIMSGEDAAALRAR